MLKSKKLISPSVLLCADTNTLAFGKLTYFKGKWFRRCKEKQTKKPLIDIDFVVTSI